MKIFIKLIFLINSFLLLANCSNNDAVSDIQNIDLYIKDHKFEPSEIVIPKNTKIRLTVHNTDNTIEEFESIDLKREKIVPAKGQVNITIAPLATGTYEFFGDFNPDTAKGRLIVK